MGNGQQKYNKDFYSLPSNLQDEVFNDAMNDWTEDQYDKADRLEDR